MGRLSAIGSLGLIVGTAYLAESAFAQQVILTEADVDQLADGAEKPDQTRLDSIAGGGTTDSPTLGNFAPVFQLTADDEASELSLAIGFGSSTPGKLQGNLIPYTHNRFRFIATTPISEKSGTSTFKFGALGTGSKASVSYIQYNSSFYFDANIYRAQIAPRQARAVTSCIQATTKKYVETRPAGNPLLAVAAFESAWQRLQKAPFQNSPSTALDRILAITLSDSGNFVPATPAERQALAGLIPLDKDLIGSIDQACVADGQGGSLESSRDLIANFLSEDDAKIADQFFDSSKTRNILFWGGTTSVAREKFEFLDAANFVKDSVSRTGFEGNAFVGLISKRGDWSARASAKYVRSYEAASDIQLCRPTSNGQQECIDGASGLPARSSQKIVEVEARRIFGPAPSQGGTRFAIAPKATIDVDSGEYAIEVPVFLTPDKDNRLDGGIRFGYRSDTDDFGIGLFVGIPFGVWF